MSTSSAATARPTAPTSTTAAPKAARSRAASPTAKPISWKDFRRRYLSREDGYKYEWVNGAIEKTIRHMDQSQYQILRNLRAFFTELLVAQKITGGLEAEIDTFFLPEAHRRPDVSYFSKKQEDLIARGDLQIPLFVIEIVSKNDNINQVVKKLQNYRDAGVQVAWLILPENGEVHVYHGPHLNEMRVCSGDVLCSASPVLPAFALPASQIFQLPA